MQALQGTVAACRPLAAAAKPRAGAAAAHGAACACCRQGFALRGAPLAAASLPRAGAARSARLSVVAAAAAEAAPSVLNMKGHALPPSAGTPTWQAIIEVGGAQQIVSEGRFYSCHSLPDAAPGQKIVFERVLATKKGADAGSLAVGHPYVKGAQVHAQVLEHFKDKKIVVFKMKAKKHYRKKQGHRQAMTRFLVTDVHYGA